MSIIRQASYRLLAEEFSMHHKKDDTFGQLREALDNPELLQVLVLLDTHGHLDNILKEIDEKIQDNLELEQTLTIDISPFANRFFLRLVNLIPTHH